MKSLTMVLLFTVAAVEGKKCLSRDYPAGSVCVCNATYCDEIVPLTLVPFGKAAIYRSDANGARADRSDVKLSSTPTGLVATLDPSTVFQKIIGFGGAFTDATGINVRALSEAAQHQFVRSYFGPSGAEYTVARVPIASTDFSVRVYSYDDVEGDVELAQFKLADEDFEYKIPFIKEAIALQKLSGGLRLFSSPWSPPGWMKTNGNMSGGGELLGEPMGEYWKIYANYFVKFFEAYAAQGINFWGTTISNEPSTGNRTDYPFQIMYLNAELERDFIKTLFGPILRSNSVSKNIEIMSMDDQRDIIVNWTNTVFADEEASAYASGIAVHWYRDLRTPIANLDIVHKNHPDKFILGTEACLGSGSNPPVGVTLGNFTRAERYAYSIITDLNNFVSGWTDWNLALDMEGGPNWVKNYVDSPIIVNADNDEFLKQPMFYAMAHFSKFLKYGSHRVDIQLPEGLSDDVQVLAAVDTEGRKVVVAMNRQNGTDVSLSFNEKGKEHLFANIDLPAHTIVTAIWN